MSSLLTRRFWPRPKRCTRLRSCHLTSGARASAARAPTWLTLLFAKLVENPKLLIVERTELDKILTEAELNLSGHVSTEQANQIGQLTGAKIIISGSIFKVDKNTHIVAKIIGAETSKVLGKSVKGSEALDVLVEQLAEQINAAINESAQDLMPPVVDKEAVIAAIKEKIGEKNTPAGDYFRRGSSSERNRA